MFSFLGSLIINFQIMYDKSKWSSGVILAVWEKGKIVNNDNPDVYRKDACGAWMQFSEHGNRDAKHGWEIDHITPVTQGGTGILSNLQPLHWKNNVEKGDSTQLKCAVRD